MSTVVLRQNSQGVVNRRWRCIITQADEGLPVRANKEELFG